MSKPVEISVSKDDAFALFGFLARYTYDGQLSVGSDTEKRALEDLCHALDDDLVERFRDDYLKFARERKR